MVRKARLPRGDSHGWHSQIAKYGQAHALEQARQIRAYVDAVRDMNAAAPERMTADELQDWSVWALAQADRIDPVVSGAFKTLQEQDA
jgi:hypothetical protein